MSEYEAPDRVGREPTVEDIRALVGPVTPHFALQVRNRVATMIRDLPEGHPARAEGERQVERLERLAFEGERRGPSVEGEPELPSIRVPGDS